MSLKAIRAVMECDCCGTEFKVNLDPAEKPGDKALADVVDEEIRTFFDISIQCDMHLCTACTKKADDFGDEDYQPTRDEIREACGVTSL